MLGLARCGFWNSQAASPLPIRATGSRGRVAIGGNGSAQAALLGVGALMWWAFDIAVVTCARCGGRLRLRVTGEDPVPSHQLKTGGEPPARGAHRGFAFCVTSRKSNSGSAITPVARPAS